MGVSIPLYHFLNPLSLLVFLCANFSTQSLLCKSLSTCNSPYTSGFFPYHCDFFIACFSYDCLSLQLPLLLIDKSPVFLSSSAVFPSVFSLFPPLSCYLLPLSSFPNQPPPPHFLQYPLSHPAFHSQCSAVSLPN